MIRLYTYLKWPVVISTLLVLPFMVLEWVKRRAFQEEFPLPLFGLLWLLPVAFILLLTPVVRVIRVGKSLRGKPLLLFLRVVFLILIAMLWTSLLLDQMPCFLGVPNCD